MVNILESWKQYGYPSAEVLHKILKSNGEETKLDDVKEVINEQLAYQLHRKPKKTIKSHLVAYWPNQIWMGDLLDMQNFSKKNNGYRYVLIIVDIFTRKAFAKALKNKEKDTVLNALKEITKENGFPTKFISDNGSEFINKSFKEYLADNNIFQETNEPGYHPSLGVIDRFSRTLKEKLFKSFTANNNVDWISVLPQMVNAYNSSPQSGILDLAPNNVPQNAEMIEELNIYKNQQGIKPTMKFKVGQIVRKLLARPTFTKGYKQKYSATTETIKAIKGVNAVLDNDQVVKLNDLQVISRVPVEIEPFKDEVKAVEIDKKIDRDIRKEGIDRSETSIRRSARERKVGQLINKYGQKIIW